MFDPRQDATVRGLPAFADFAERLARVRRLAPLYGAGETDRLALAFAYAASGETAAGDAWRPFWRELMMPTWFYFSVANMLNFSAHDELIEFEDDLRLVARDYGALMAATGWDRARLDATLTDDFVRGWGHGTHVIVAFEEVPKSPENLVLGSTGSDWPRISRLLLAMQLAAPGDVGVGRVFHGRRDRLNVLGGISSWARPSQGGPGQRYELKDSDIPTIRRLYAMLLDFDHRHRARMTNIATALDRFAGTFDRSWGKPQDKLIDDVIALEAVVGTKDELAFTIAFRVSGMLEPSDSKRLAAFRLLKSFYSTRSDLVHGAKLKQRAVDDLEREPELRDVVRRLLRGLLPQIGGPYEPTLSFVSDRLDLLLLDPEERAKLAEALR